MSHSFRPSRIPVDVWCEIAMYLSIESLVRLGAVSVPMPTNSADGSAPLPYILDF